MTTKTETANRTYQDTVFRKLFSSKDKLIELYNALDDANYGPDTPVEITTLEDVFYIDRKNDLGFTIADKFVVLAEHQSTINPNLPLRHTVYIGRTFEHLIAGLNVYSTTLQKIPAPEFFVIYTGDEEWEVKTLQLSDAFKTQPPENSMNLVVKVINIKYNENNKILKRSKTLEGYSRLIFYIKNEREKGITLLDSINNAIARCIKEDCLSEFLKKYSLEVENMLYEEITWEQFAELRAKEAAEKAYTDGRSEGIYALVEALHEIGQTKDEISVKLKDKFNLSNDEIENYITKL